MNLFAKKKQKTLAVHLRGTSYKTSANHPFPTTNVQTINLIEKILSENNYSNIFLCTEDLNYLNIIKNKFKNKVIFLKMFIDHIMMMLLKYIQKIYIDLNLERTF